MRLSKKARRHLAGILGILAGLAVAYILVFSQSGYLQLRRNQLELEAQMKENQQLKQEMNSYMEQIEGLKNDPSEVERLLRENNYARPGEIIVTLPEEK